MAGGEEPPKQNAALWASVGLVGLILFSLLLVHGVARYMEPGHSIPPVPIYYWR